MSIDPTEGESRHEDVTPAPDDPRKADYPHELTRRSWFYVLRKTVREFRDDQCTDLAAALTYYAVLAILPASVALVSLLGVLGRAGESVDMVLEALDPLVSEQVLGTVEPALRQVAESPRAGTGLLIGLAGALWVASGYVGAFGRAMNRIYEISEGRPFWKLRPWMLLITLAALVLSAVVVLGLIVSGPVAEAIGATLGLGDTVLLVFNIAKWPVLAGLVIMVVAILYYATPNVQQPKFRWLSIGAVVAILTWVLASVAFSIYVANFANYNRTYGSLAGVAVALLFLWITNLALLFGAELDAELERGRQLQAGIAAEREIQLPARDTRTITKAREREEEDIRLGTEIRHQAGSTGQKEGS
ncbi:YihY/virulence factor BrkB family protein [Nocardioides sp.]|uniref:YihY/virulence factor BrkB family protein n=1 Tax=Nocardioides sp. TaxID=35761 RepID=UPI0027336A46|nr:YihY/virulence factor BrkB family protein [Nocardioides sp.]MDP3892025.1 YihY/virulence factor BrkB family protein [Nocardioides sp.]